MVCYENISQKRTRDLPFMHHQDKFTATKIVAGRCRQKHDYTNFLANIFAIKIHLSEIFWQLYSLHFVRFKNI